MSERLQITEIRVDGGAQPRAWLDEATWKEYAEAMTEGATFPPVTVYHDGGDYWLADGFHRIKAAKHIGMIEIAADVRQGDRRDAILFSVGANADHGLRRSNKDKRRAVETLLRDEQWRQWSDREIARRCGVNDKTVAKVRAELSPVTAEIRSEKPTERTYTTKHGTTAKMKTENIGRHEERTTTTTTTTTTTESGFVEPDSELEDDDFDAYDDEAEADEPGVYEPTVSAFYGDAGTALRWVRRYIEARLEEVGDASAQHEVVNELVKWLRSMSIEMNRRAG